MSWRPRLILLLLPLLVAGCGTPSAGSRQPSDPPTATAAASVAATPANAIAATAESDASPAAFRTDAAEIGAIVWASAIDPETKAPRESVAEFSIEAPALYATLPVVRIRQGTVLAVAWSYNDTSMPALDSAITAPADAEAIWVEFHLTLPAGQTWPPGIYAVAVSVDGALAQQADAEVVE